MGHTELCGTPQAPLTAAASKVGLTLHFCTSFCLFPRMALGKSQWKNGKAEKEQKTPVKNKKKNKNKKKKENDLHIFGQHLTAFESKIPFSFEVSNIINVCEPKSQL